MRMVRVVINERECVRVCVFCVCMCMVKAKRNRKCITVCVCGWVGECVARACVCVCVYKIEKEGKERGRKREGRFYKKKRIKNNNYGRECQGPGASLSPVWLWPYPIFPRLKQIYIRYNEYMWHVQVQICKFPILQFVIAARAEERIKS